MKGRKCFNDFLIKELAKERVPVLLLQDKTACGMTMCG